MKEAIIVGILAGVLATVGFTLGVHVGKNNAVVQTCKDGQLYVGVGPSGDMLVAEVVYPLDKAQCNEA